MEPQGFLKLPREIRQQVLSLTFDVDMDTQDARVLHWVEQAYQATTWTMTLCEVHSRIAEDVAYLASRWRENLRTIADRLIEIGRKSPEPYMQLAAAWKLENSLLGAWSPPGFGQQFHLASICRRRHEVFCIVQEQWELRRNDFNAGMECVDLHIDELNFPILKGRHWHRRSVAEANAFKTMWYTVLKEMGEDVKRTTALANNAAEEAIKELEISA